MSFCALCALLDCHILLAINFISCRFGVQLFGISCTYTVTTASCVGTTCREIKQIFLSLSWRCIPISLLHAWPSTNHGRVASDTRRTNLRDKNSNERRQNRDNNFSTNQINRSLEFAFGGQARCYRVCVCHTSAHVCACSYCVTFACIKTCFMHIFIYSRNIKSALCVYSHKKAYYATD